MFDHSSAATRKVNARDDAFASLGEDDRARRQNERGQKCGQWKKSAQHFHG